MTYFELLFVAWGCLGDSSVPVLGLSVKPIPAAARPLLAGFRVGSAEPICRPRPELERFPTRAAAERRIVELGPGAAPRLRWCQRFRCWDRTIEWKGRLVVDGREIRQ